MNFSTTPAGRLDPRPRERAVTAEDRVQVLGIEALSEVGGSDQITEQSGDDLSLGTYLGGDFNSGAAFAAELRATRNFGGAIRARHFASVTSVATGNVDGRGYTDSVSAPVRSGGHAQASPADGWDARPPAADPAR
jgi:hypothetical protein